MEEKCVVYKHTNVENGLVYYGIAENYEHRWNNGFGYQANKRFWNDIVKYGWKNFKHEILLENISRDEAKFLEGMLIQETRSYLSENGYNQNLGEAMQYKEIVNGDVVENKPTRNGRGGTPVVYDDEVYLTIKDLCDEIGEDQIAISQMLNPNSPRKVPRHLLAKGLRYATDDEAKNYLEFCRVK